MQLTVDKGALVNAIAINYNTMTAVIQYKLLGDSSDGGGSSDSGDSSDVVTLVTVLTMGQ